MQLAKVRLPDGTVSVGTLHEGQLHLFPADTVLGELLASPEPFRLADELKKKSTRHLAASEVTFLAPIDSQEVWAAGVTYKRSKIAREEESVGAAVFYDKVYSADRPELFCKAAPWRVVGPGGDVRIRRDGRWNVPEPELALVISPTLKIVGYTIGNDMSSRDIEGENPLYLPQAKVYDGSCAIGPVITLAPSLPKFETVQIKLVIERGGNTAFEGTTTLAQMARTPESLVEWLGRETSFPHGAILMTGTGIVPPDAFTLASGDHVHISIDGIGTLSNRVA
jgi:2-dehydro-3-deoxy-D-arabinonate dehydratase